MRSWPCWCCYQFTITSKYAFVYPDAAPCLTAPACACGPCRWTIGNSPENPHLRGGVIAAFGLVRTAAAADMLQLASADGPFTLDVIGSSALYAGQSTLMFAFAAAAIEAGFRQGLIRLVDPPVEVPVSKSSD